jgi:hypothetical protein
MEVIIIGRNRVLRVEEMESSNLEIEEKRKTGFCKMNEEQEKSTQWQKRNQPVSISKY